MSGPAADHAAFDELAAGYALDALEPGDEELFLLHAADCDRCRALLASFRAVSVELAEMAPPAEPSSQLGDRILAAARSGNGPQRRAEIIPLRARGRRWLKPATVAAAVALIAGGGTWAGLAATAPGPQSPLAACARPHACQQVALAATATGRTAATVIVRDGVAWMQPAAMAANPGDEIYVLWQITEANVPRAVGSFDLRADSGAPVRVGELAVPYPGTRAFAVSLEHGRNIPARPSKTLALGQVPRSSALPPAARNFPR